MRTIKKARRSHNRKPLYEAIVHRCKRAEIAGAAVFRGLEGFGESAETHCHRMMQKDQPIVVTIVDTGRISTA
jgi:PII-like signaling protein